ncbi:30S ribosomal protein S6 [bacterium]|nr:30S ribosomal protein S6 [candidate division CSSED10-310 bacterium]
MYEIIAILNPNVTTETVEAKISDWTGIVKEYGAELSRIDRWGKRNLAYEVKKFNQGFFLLFHVDGKHDVIAELERRFRIADDVIRYQTVKLSDQEYRVSVDLLDHYGSRSSEDVERFVGDREDSGEGDDDRPRRRDRDGGHRRSSASDDEDGYPGRRRNGGEDFGEDDE